jgi:nicotinate phosphoribosyltransferase
MTIFDGRRLTNTTMNLDMDGIRRGWYSDKYFENVARILQALRDVDYGFAGKSPRPLPLDPSRLPIGDILVEVQVFNRRAPQVLVAGVDAALTMLRHGTGYFEGERFISTWEHLEVEAVYDGAVTRYDGHPENVQPVIKIRGRYREFALLETPILGILGHASRVATNCYEVLKVTNAKPLLFFPARFDLPQTQAVDGYAYWLAVQRYNHDSGKNANAFVSTDAQGSWWGGRGTGTVPHALIANFLGDTAEAMWAFAQYMPVDVPRIALVDFDNDTVAGTLHTINAFWPHYRAALETGDVDEQKRWTLYGVRLDTSGNMRDVSLEPDGPYGVNPALVNLVRKTLDNAWQHWHLPDDLVDTAKSYCRNVRIVVTGGFDKGRVEQYERDQIPVDIYGAGSKLIANDEHTNTDYTMDVVRVQLDGQWVDMAKVGRKPNHNPDLQRVDLSGL